MFTYIDAKGQTHILTEAFLKQKEEEAKLYEMCKEYCEWYTSGNTGNVWSPNGIYNALRRGGIYTLDDLKNADEERLAKFRGIGGKKFSLIMVMKLSLE